MDVAKKVVQSAAILAALVLVVAVLGTFADGVKGDQHSDSMLTRSDSAHFDPAALSHAEFALNHDPSDGIRDGSRLHKAWKHNHSDEGDKDDANGDPTPTPEPATLFLLVVGVGMLFLGRRRLIES